MSGAAAAGRPHGVGHGWQRASVQGHCLAGWMLGAQFGECAGQGEWRVAAGDREGGQADVGGGQRCARGEVADEIGAGDPVDRGQAQQVRAGCLILGRPAAARQRPPGAGPDSPATVWAIPSNLTRSPTRSAISLAISPLPLPPAPPGCPGQGPPRSGLRPAPDATAGDTALARPRWGRRLLQHPSSAAQAH